MLTKHQPFHQSRTDCPCRSQAMRKVHRPKSAHRIDKPGPDAASKPPTAPCRAGTGNHAASRQPPKTRHRHPPAVLLLVRAAAITSMSFAVAFGFLSGTIANAANYDPNSFAIGVAALFGASCGAMGIFISRIRQMKAELRRLESRLDQAEDRNWEISEAQERAKNFFEAQGDVIVRRDGDGAITYANDAFCALAGRQPRGLARAPRSRCRSKSKARPRSCRRHARPRPENRRARRCALDRLARSDRARR